MPLDIMALEALPAKDEAEGLLHSPQLCFIFTWTTGECFITI